MTKPVMAFQEVRECLKQRFPMLMIDKVVELIPNERIAAVKNITGNELQFLGHFPEFAIMPGTLIIEAIGQAASILFAKTTASGARPGEFLVLGSVIDMRFLVPVVPGDQLRMDVQILKLAGDLALVEGSASVNDITVARGKLGFARRSLDTVGAG
jgi:3-hydroxyacyl-[acyl-carrier-protein] dehydratase